jgi:hypothetical protein
MTALEEEVERVRERLVRKGGDNPNRKQRVKLAHELLVKTDEGYRELNDRFVSVVDKLMYYNRQMSYLAPAMREMLNEKMGSNGK